MPDLIRSSFSEDGWEHVTVTVDCHYKGGPGIAAVFLLISRRMDRSETHAAFVDANTAHATPRLLSALDAQGVSPSDVRFIIVTHVHLDHCGGTAALLAACPKAEVLCHPRAERHLVDPARLKAAAETVYGTASFQRLYSSVDAIDPLRVRALQDHGSVELCGARVLLCLHVRGHARHHLVLHDPVARCVFAGDAMGICYTQRLREAGLHRPVLYPATPPSDFEPEEARKAVRRIAALEGADEYMLTHFGGVPATPETRRELLSGLAEHEGWYKQTMADLADGRDEAALDAKVLAQLLTWMGGQLRAAGASADAEVYLLQEFLRQDLEIHANGVVLAAKRDYALETRPKGKL